MGDPLDSIYAKIDRANEHIRNLNAEINTLIDGDAYRIVSEPEGDARKSSIRVVGPEPPLRLAVVAGEIVHQLRSSLDHLVCQLAIANGNPSSVATNSRSVTRRGNSKRPVSGET